MPWKKTEAGVLEAGADGNPIWVHGPNAGENAGKEVPLDADKMFQNAATLRREAQTHRERAEAAEAALAPFKSGDELLDPEAARSAIDTVKSLTGKKAEDAAARDQAVKEAVEKAIEPWKAKVKEREDQRDGLAVQVENLTVGTAFEKAKDWLTEKTTIPTPSMARAEFGRYFKPTADGKGLEGKDEKGMPFYNAAGEVASFEEALEILISRSPNKNDYLRAANPAGANTPPGAPNRLPPVPASQVAAMPAVDRLERAFGA